MLIRNMLLKYYAPESGGEGGGGGGIEITPEIQKLIDERVTSEVTGLKTKNSELLGTIKQQKENLSRFEGTAKGDNPDLTAIGTAGNWKKHFTSNKSTAGVLIKLESAMGE